MAFCSSCGASIAENTAFCPQCGKAQGTAAPAGPAAPQAQSGLAENVAGGLCYVLGWITGIVFLVIDKRPFVRFHAAQSIVVFGSLHILRIVLGMVFGFGWFFGGLSGVATFGFAGLLFAALGLLTLVLWLLLMIKAYQGERLRVPVAADFADQIAGK
jgi:uncharacterized membrane protein